MADKEQINRLIQQLSMRMNTPAQDIENAVNSSSYGKLLSKLPPDKARQMGEILADEEKAKEFLSTPQAKAIIKRIMG